MKNYESLLELLQKAGNYRSLPDIVHQGKYIEKEGRQMLNFSSNDYLGLASDQGVYAGFMRSMENRNLPFSSSSSRLLTGNFAIYNELESLIASRFGCENALLFNSGYHANVGILPAIADKHSLVIADKLVHASLIDGMVLAGCPFRRYRHNDYEHLRRILHKEAGRFEQYIIVTESIFSMDGDEADLRQLVKLKELYPDIVLYVDEAHAVGVRGFTGLGLAQETGTIGDIDLLVGTLGKALASMGAYVVCSQTMKNYLVNRMRPLIFSTALPPVNVAWSYYIFQRLMEFEKEREQLGRLSLRLQDAILQMTGIGMSSSHIVPYIIGGNEECICKAAALQEGGCYVLPVRPPTVPAGTSRLRFSLTANMTMNDLDLLIHQLQ